MLVLHSFLHSMLKVTEENVDDLSTHVELMERMCWQKYGGLIVRSI